MGKRNGRDLNEEGANSHSLPEMKHHSSLSLFVDIGELFGGVETALVFALSVSTRLPFWDPRSCIDGFHRKR